jgi:L-fuconolactonase
MVSTATPTGNAPIIDSHVHVFRQWPFAPDSPHQATRGRAERLIHKIDENGVERALVICATGPNSPDNNEYAAECAKRYRDRLVVFPSVDPHGSPTYHTPGAARRLAQAVEKFGAKGILHVVGPDYAWLEGADGLEFLAEAERSGLMVSLPISPDGLPTLAAVARRFASIVFLCHHLGGARILRKGGSDALIRPLLSTAAVPNIWHKVSGFHHIARVPWDYPHRDLLWIVRFLYDLVGPRRLCWGSDFPVVESAMTYRQSLEIIRQHCTFISPADQSWILGGNLATLLET